MSLFDLTPAGALLSAVEIAHSKDRQYALRTRRDEHLPTSSARRHVKRMLSKIWTPGLQDTKLVIRAKTAARQN
jgi:hypothetical protein